MSIFRARIRPTIGPVARKLVGVYETTPGATGPGCCPEALAAVIDHICSRYGALSEPDLRHIAHLLRGDGDEDDHPPALRQPPANLIAECGGPCEREGFAACDCGLLEQLNPFLQ